MKSWGGWLAHWIGVKWLLRATGRRIIPHQNFTTFRTLLEGAARFGF